jgi:hypothetical protein
LWITLNTRNRGPLACSAMGKRNGYWVRHPKPLLQDLLMQFHQAGWKIISPRKGGGYYKAHCPCPLKHKTSIHLTPSNPGYAFDKMKWLQRQECFRKRTGGDKP